MRLAFCALLILTLCLSNAAAAELSISDSRKVQHFDAVPQRVVALSWSMIEQVLSLDIMPVGVADAQGYANWVVEPALPAGVVDVGLRHEPNLERIAELEPDVILISDDQVDIAEQLQIIAPVVHFVGFSKTHDNVQAAKDIYLELSTLFDRQPLAQQRLKSMDDRIDALANQVRAHFEALMPPVTIVRFLDTARVAVYGENSPTSHVLRRFGIESELSVPASTWGLALRKVPELGQVGAGYLMSILPFDHSAALYDTTLWQSMPFVQADRFRELAAMWTYGGALSIERIAELIAAELLAIDAVSAQGANP